MGPSLGQRVRWILIAVATTVIYAMHSAAAYAAPYAAIIMDMRTGKILYSNNADTRLYPASLTKLMTLYITFEEIQRGGLTLDTQIDVSANAAHQEPSRLGLRTGEKIALRYLIRAAAVKSANDAAAAIGDAIGGDEAGFAKVMNRTAQALGMRNSTFKNANGLTRRGHMSTAHDIAILARHVFYDFPQYYNIFSRRETFAGIATVYSTNRKFLESYPGADGMKTGFTWASGFNLVASAKHGNKRLLGVIFGARSVADRNRRMARLFNTYFSRIPENVTVRPPVKPDLSFLAPQLIASAARHKTQLITTGTGGYIAVASSIRPEPRPGDTLQPGQADLLARQVAQEMNLKIVAEQVAAAVDATITTPGSASGGARTVASAATITPAPRPDGNNPAAGGVTRVAARTDAGTANAADTPFSPQAPQTLAIAPAPRPTEIAQREPAPKVRRLATVPASEVQAPNGAPRVQPAVATLAAASAATIPATAAPAVQKVAVATRPAQAPATISNIEATSSAAAVAGPATTSPQQARPEIVFASVSAPGNAPASAPQQVIGRMSGSGGSNWAITLGRFYSRAQAERKLLETALAQGGFLSGSQRKVVRHPNGFAANFVGLSQDQADLACRQLQARNVQCFTMAP